VGEPFATLYDFAIEHKVEAELAFPYLDRIALIDLIYYVLNFHGLFIGLYAL